MSNSVRPHRRQPTRLPRPWDSPGKNTGVGCHFLLQCMQVKSESEVAQSCRLLATPWTAAYQAPPSMGFSRQEYWSGVPLPSLINWMLLLLLLLSRFSRVQLCATPQMSAHQAPPSLGFSGQEHWRGLPFPSPKSKVKVKSLSRIQLLATPWTAAHQAPPSMGFSRQEYWSGVP